MKYLIKSVYLFGVIYLANSLDCKDRSYDINGKRCCSKCSPGQGLVADCTHGNDTKCATCIKGKTFSSVEWHIGKCQNCSECKKDSHVKTECTLMKDTVCECNVDFYYSNIAKQCLLCNFCPIGFGAIIPCTGLQNSVCYKCPNGTFSDVKSATLPCKQCTKCSHGQVQFKACTDTEDAICYGHPKDHTSQPTKTKERDFDVIPVYCAILGAVILGLLCYVIFKQYTRLKNRKIHKGHDPHEEVEYSKASGGDSGVFIESDFIGKQYNQLTRVKDLPLHKRKELEKNLAMSTSNGDTWKNLAKELGYQDKKIEQFESSSQEPSGQVNNMMNHWSKHKHSTVGVLIKSLKNINRSDIIRILHSDIKEIKHINHHIV